MEAGLSSQVCPFEELAMLVVGSLPKPAKRGHQEDIHIRYDNKRGSIVFRWSWNYHLWNCGDFLPIELGKGYELGSPSVHH